MAGFWDIIAAAQQGAGPNELNLPGIFRGFTQRGRADIDRQMHLQQIMDQVAAAQGQQQLAAAQGQYNPYTETARGLYLQNEGSQRDLDQFDEFYRTFGASPQVAGFQRQGEQFDTQQDLLNRQVGLDERQVGLGERRLAAESLPIMRPFGVEPDPLQQAQYNEVLQLAFPSLAGVNQQFAAEQAAREAAKSQALEAAMAGPQPPLQSSGPTDSFSTINPGRVDLPPEFSSINPGTAAPAPGGPVAADQGAGGPPSQPFIGGLQPERLIQQTMQRQQQQQPPPVFNPAEVPGFGGAQQQTPFAQTPLAQGLAGLFAGAGQGRADLAQQPGFGGAKSPQMPQQQQTPQYQQQLQELNAFIEQMMQSRGGGMTVQDLLNLTRAPMLQQ